MRRWLVGLLTAFALTGVAAPGALALSQKVLVKRLDTQMRRASPASGAHVANLTTGTLVYRKRDRVDRIPASNEKLWTAVAALETVGPDAVLTTTALAARPVNARGVLRGSLYLRGEGDPTLSTARLEVLAQELADAGLERVTGRVIGDESAFDRRRGPRTRLPDDEVGGPLGALVVDRSGYLQPAEAAAEVLARQLRDAGVRVSVRTRTGVTPKSATVLGVAESASVRTLIELMNAPSDNFIAEMLLKVVGAGRTVAGAAAATEILADRYGLSPVIHDGSGLSRRDRASPRELVDLLGQLVTDEPFYSSLAIMGRTGTLADRLESDYARGRCRGKTGTLRDVSVLSGYCETAGGDILAYSLMMNDTSVDAARTQQDKMVAAIARYE